MTEEQGKRYMELAREAAADAMRFLPQHRFEREDLESVGYLEICEAIEDLARFAESIRNLDGYLKDRIRKRILDYTRHERRQWRNRASLTDEQWQDLNRTNFGLREKIPGSSWDTETIEAAVKKLPRDQREVIRLRFWSDLNAGQIAEQAGMSVRAVERLLSKARATLAKKLGGLRGGMGDITSGGAELHRNQYSEHWQAEALRQLVPSGSSNPLAAVPLHSPLNYCGVPLSAETMRGLLPPLPGTPAVRRRPAGRPAAARVAR